MTSFPTPSSARAVGDEQKHCPEHGSASSPGLGGEHGQGLVSLLACLGPNDVNQRSAFAIT